MQYKSFTKQAKKAMDLAVKIAKEKKQGQLGSEYILAGLLREGSGVAWQVLHQLSVDEEDVFRLIDELAMPEGKVLLADPDHMTPETKKVLDGASAAAVRFDCDKVGTEHLLFSIIENRGCAAARLLIAMGINLGKMCTEILVAMGKEDQYSKEEGRMFRTGKRTERTVTPILEKYASDLTKKSRKW